MTAPALIRKSFPALTNLRPGDEEQGLVEAIVNTTGVVDLQKENLQPGCWTPILKAMQNGEVDYPTILWGHDWQIPVGKVLHAEELMPGDARLKSFKAGSPAGGLRIVGQYNLETQRGREAYSDVKGGYIKQWSVGYLPDDGAKFDQKGVLQVTGVAAWPEVSNVLVGASPGTHVTATKTAEDLMANPDLTIADKALAVEQVVARAIQSDQKDEALDAAISALHKLSEEVAGLEERVADRVIGLFLERFDRFQTPPQHSDPENSGEEEPIMHWARRNVRPS